MKFAFSVSCLCLFFTGTVAAAERPNIVMIFTDDQRHDAVGYAGNDAVATPHLDSLAMQGLVFRNCFVNTSICAISRANLLTGQYPGRHGISDFHKTLTVEQLEQTVPARLRNAGYQTAFFGKWGIGDSPERTHEGAAIFDYWAGQPMQTCFFHGDECRYLNFNGFDRPLDDLCDCPADSKGRVGYRNRIGLANLENPSHVDSEITPMHVERFLDGRDSDKPFCLMVFFKGPHSPHTDWDPVTEHATDGKEISRPASATLENAELEPEIIKQSLGRPSGMKLVQDQDVFDRHMRDYYRQIVSLDIGVGRIVELLKDRGLDENTVVLFTSDNGHYKGEHGLSGKWLMHEPSLRVPGFFFDPRNPRGDSTDRMVITTDFSATMLSLAGLEIPEDMSGSDLTTLNDDPEVKWREDFLYDHPYAHRGAIPRTIGVRTKTHTYTRYTDPDPPFEQLFDLRVDPDQLQNLAELDEHRATLENLRNRCDALLSENN